MSQWGLICPLVAFVTLGAFAYSVLLTSSILYGVLVLTMIGAVALFAELLVKHIKCSRAKNAQINCEV